MSNNVNLKRRGLINLATIAATGILNPARAAKSSQALSVSPITPFVLVHGAWHGGWCWRRVAEVLRHNGHPVFTPTLTGLGERAHLLTAQTGLSTHIKDVTATLEWEEIENVVLVGHSYAGIVIGGVADRVRSRIRRLVFLDTLIPQTDQSLAEAANVPIEKLRSQSPDGISAPVPPLESFGVDPTTSEGRWLARRLTPQPIAAFAEKLQFQGSGISGIPSSYIRCTRPSLPLTAHYEQAARAQGWPVATIETGHDAMVTAPLQLARLLEREAAR